MAAGRTGRDLGISGDAAGAGRPSWRAVLLAATLGLAIADAAIVVLALPPLLGELDTTVEGVAAVVGIYTLTLAAALPAALWGLRRFGAPSTAAAGLLGFAAASLVCGASGELGVLLVARAAQAGAAAALLVGGFELLGAGHPGGSGRRLWVGAAMAGTALGPALGGVLTELLDWRAIFLVQVPLAVVAGFTCRALPALHAPRPATAATPSPHLPLVGLGLLSAALVGVLFLLTLLLVTGWSLSPLAAAGVLSVLPVAALAGARVPIATGRAPLGCALVAAGVGTLAFLPTDAVGWAIPPQILAGAGMGLALPVFAELLGERNATDAARLLAARFLGISAMLVALAPLLASELDTATFEIRERGTAAVLDSALPPETKLDLAETAAADFDPADPRGALDATFNGLADDLDAESQPALEATHARVDDAFVAGINSAFAPAFLICAALALLAAATVFQPAGAPRARVAVGTLAVLAVLPAAQALGKPSLEADPVVIADPCESGISVEPGDLEGIAQGAALFALDRAACGFEISSAALLLSLVDPDVSERLERERGFEPPPFWDTVGDIIQ